ncbi:AAA family ATPase [Photobacterium piscicola]|uniref:AAA family ATPase n=1 Tax=Photobacterium piscicola TaxID=1378299 RepID=UPI002E19F05F|nr:AAA family ATPase [Photobacterium piscicola]
MMQNIKINNFICLNDIDMDIKKLTILIGPQSSGKSLISKLIYFFQEDVTKTYFKSIQNNGLKNELDKEVIEIFENYFDKSIWGKQQFIIRYQFDENGYFIIENKVSSRTSKLTLTLSKDLIRLFRVSKNRFSELLNRTNNDLKKSGKKTESKYFLFRDFLYDVVPELYGSSIEPFIQFNNYIPASRSYFSAISKNIFSLLSENQNFDPFVKEFGRDFEFACDLHLNNNKYREEIDDNEDDIKYQKILSNMKNDVHELTNKIINGDIFFEKDEYYIIKKNIKYKISSCSSGQQESFPLLTVLNTIPFFWQKYPQQYFIEEPEAHLFPEAQYDVLKIISNIINLTNSNCFITTHSPYILSAINNMLLLSSIIDFDEPNREKIKILIDNNIDYKTRLNFSDISAFSLNNGEIVNICDTEEEMIGTNIIDSVSDIFNKEYDLLLNLFYGD